jgi:hypothetical protein
VETEPLGLLCDPCTSRSVSQSASMHVHGTTFLIAYRSIAALNRPCCLRLHWASIPSCTFQHLGNRPAQPRRNAPHQRRIDAAVRVLCERGTPLAQSCRIFGDVTRSGSRRWICQRYGRLLVSRKSSSQPSRRLAADLLVSMYERQNMEKLLDMFETIRMGGDANRDPCGC